MCSQNDFDSIPIKCTKIKNDENKVLSSISIPEHQNGMSAF